MVTRTGPKPKTATSAAAGSTSASHRQAFPHLQEAGNHHRKWYLGTPFLKNEIIKSALFFKKFGVYSNKILIFAF